MRVTDLFNFVIDQNIADEDVDGYLDKVSSVTFQSFVAAITLYKHIPAV